MNFFNNKNNLISYTVSKESSNNCYVSINNGEVVVNAPWYFSNRQIQSIVEQKRYWILEKIKEYQESNAEYVEKGSVNIFGSLKQIIFHYKSIKFPTLNIVNNTVDVVLPRKYKKIEKCEIEKIIVEKLYDKIAEQQLENFMEKARISLGLAPDFFEIKRMQNNVLAVFNSNQNKIIINPDIVKLDKELINYIVFHEFCHLKYKIHTKNFWKMIESNIPNYLELDKRLQNFTY